MDAKIESLEAQRRHQVVEDIFKKPNLLITMKGSPFFFFLKLIFFFIHPRLFPICISSFYQLHVHE